MELDNTDNYFNHPLNNSEQKIVNDYSQKLPANMQKTALESLVAIYFIDNFKGGGMTLEIFDEKGNIRTVLIINAGIFDYSLSEWIEYRDSSPFIPDPDYQLSYNTGKENAFLYILLHELAHIYDYHNSVIYPDPGKSPFSEEIWKEMGILNGITLNRQKERMHFYGFNGEPEVSYKEAESLLQELKQSPLTTPYSLIGAMDDFAEFSAWYLYQSYFGGEISLTLKKLNQEIFFYSISEKIRQSERSAFIGQLYGVES